MKVIKAALCLLGTMLLLSGTAFAAEAPINIKSDRAHYEANSGIYSGNVVMEQGPLRIEADKIVIYGVDKKVERLEAYGTPASFFHSNVDGSITRASARAIEYHIVDAQVLLQYGASIDHQGSEIHGERIVYNSRRQTVSAEGSSSDEQSGRIKMILQPQTSPAEPEQSADQEADGDARTQSP